MPRTGTVAVKSLLPVASSSASAISDFKAEIAILERLSHSCLVGCLGAGERPNPKGGAPLLFLVLEAVTGGDLRDMVINGMANAKLYSDADVTKWCHQMARGLHYLHTRSPMVIHRDLKVRPCDAAEKQRRAEACCALAMRLSSSGALRHAAPQLENILLDSQWNAKLRGTVQPDRSVVRRGGSSLPSARSLRAPRF